MQTQTDECQLAGHIGTSREAAENGAEEERRLGEARLLVDAVEVGDQVLQLGVEAQLRQRLGAERRPLQARLAAGAALAAAAPRPPALLDTDREFKRLRSRHDE